MKRALHQNTNSVSYDPSFEADTQSWADHLLSINSLSHATGTGYGENLYWAGSSVESYKSCVEAVDSW